MVPSQGPAAASARVVNSCWSARPLLILLLMNCCVVGATVLPIHQQAALRLRASLHLKTAERQQRMLMDAAGRLLERMPAPGPIGSRVLQQSAPDGSMTSAAPIRIHTDFHVEEGAMSSSNKTKIIQALAATVLTFQEYLQVRLPAGPSGLLASPAYLDASTCTQVPQDTSGAFTCGGPGFYPTFDPSLPRTDIRAPFCGPARINPAHVMSTQACTMQASQSAAGGPGSGAGLIDPACTTNAANLTGGVQTDMYVYVTADASTCGTNVLAYASTCLFHPVTNRPTMGFFNVCPLALAALSVQQLVSTMVHELTHTLGFAPDLWDPTNGLPGARSLFISDSGARLPVTSVVATLPTDPARGPSTRPPTPMIVSPSVLREVRAHFECPTLVGAALEDQGGQGSVGSHWEYNLFQGEMMTAQAPADADWQRLSRMTLALLEDTGWFYANWSHAPPLEWGRGVGCALPTLTCSAFMAAHPRQPFFCEPSVVGSACSFNGRSWGSCRQDPFSQCGIISSSTITAGYTATSAEPHCVSPTYTHLGAVGPNARCVPAFTGPSVTTLPWPCRQTRCVNISGGTAAGGTAGDVAYTLQLTYGSGTGALVCNSTFRRQVGADGGPGEVVESWARPGCPVNVSDVCATLECPAGGCSVRGGDCFGGRCICRLGFSGADCSLSLMDPALLPQPPGPSPAAGPGMSPRYPRPGRGFFPLPTEGDQPLELGPPSPIPAIQLPGAFPPRAPPPPAAGGVPLSAPAGGRPSPLMVLLSTLMAGLVLRGLLP